MRPFSVAVLLLIGVVSRVSGQNATLPGKLELRSHYETIAARLSYEGDVTYYVPQGRWTNFLTGEVVEGPGWARETHGFMSLPLMVRPNSVIAVGSQEDRPDYDYGAGVTLQVYELADGGNATTVIPSVKGDVDATFAVRREGHTITVEKQGVCVRFQVLLVGVPSVASVEGGMAEGTQRGTLVTPVDGAKGLSILLDGAP